jgi:hypothetical protein
MAASIDVTGTWATFAAGFAADFTGLTVGPSASLLIGLLVSEGNLVSPTMNWDSLGSNQLMDLIGSQANAQDHWVYFFGLHGPAIGAKTLHAEWNSPSVVSGVNATSLNNAAGWRNFVAASGSDTDPQVTIPSASDSVVLAAMKQAGTTWSARTLTSIFESAGPPAAAEQYGTGAASVLAGWTIPTNAWTAIGIDIMSVSTFFGEIQAKRSARPAMFTPGFAR